MADPEQTDQTRDGERPPPPRLAGEEKVEVRPAPAGEEEGRRPTPVRMAMEGVEGDASPPPEEDRAVVEPTSGTEWVVTLSGRSGSGILPLRSIPLMELTFSKGQEPERPLRRVLTRGEDLVGLTDEDLLDLLAVSEPYRPPQGPPSTEDDRPRRGKGRRGPRD